MPPTSSRRNSPVTAWGPLEIAIEMLITAGESGKRDDIEAATEQVEIVLRGQRLLIQLRQPRGPPTLSASRVSRL
jgi:hypothetical protein